MLDILRRRRSIRKYKDKKIEPDLVDQLKEAALRSPSSRGIGSWRFLFITDKAKLDELSRSKEHGSSFLKGAALGVVVCGSEDESDVWIEDCSIASIIMQLTGESIGLGSCWIQIRNRTHRNAMASEDFVRTVLHLSDNMRVESIISFGYPDEDLPPVPEESLEYSKIL